MIGWSIKLIERLHIISHIEFYPPSFSHSEKKKHVKARLASMGASTSSGTKGGGFGEFLASQTSVEWDILHLPPAASSQDASQSPPGFWHL